MEGLGRVENHEDWEIVLDRDSGACDLQGQEINRGYVWTGGVIATVTGLI